MPAGRHKLADPGTLHALAHQLYWDFRRLEEGTTRPWFDQEEYERSSAKLKQARIRLSSEQIASIQQVVEGEIQEGRLLESEKGKRLRDLRNANLSATREWLSYVAGQEATKQKTVPGEPEVLAALLEAENPEQVRRICQDSFVTVERELAPGVIRKTKLPNWPISSGSVLPQYLAQFAPEFVSAKKDPRFPKATLRPSTRRKQLWFLSRALAGAVFGVKPRTAINMVGSKRPEEIFEESRAGKPRRRQAKRKRE